MAFNAVLHQILIMVLLMAVGYLIYKIDILNREAVSRMTRFLMLVVSPVVIVYSFQLRFTPELFREMLIAAASGCAAHIVPILLGPLLFQKKLVDDEHRGVLRYAVVYSNAGFVGIPLLAAVTGTRGVFFASIYCVFFNLFNWTHGVFIFNGRPTRRSIIRLLLNPNLIAVAVGILVFCFSIRFPPLLDDGMKYIFNLNTPLAVIVLGAMVAQNRLKAVFTDLWVWPGVLMRNLVLPFLAVLALHFAGVHGSLLLECMVPIACPVAGNTALLADLYGADTRFPVKLIAISTLLCVLTIPLLIYVVDVLHF